MKTPALVLSLLLLLGADARAETEEAPANRSHFAPGEISRNPFWPIGWEPAAENSQESARPAVRVTPKDLIVSSILVGDPSLAVINGRECAEGDRTKIRIGGNEVELHLVAVHDGVVVVQLSNQNLTVPLRRK